MTQVVIVFHSGMGHTAAVAKAARDGVLSIPGTAVDMVYTSDVANNWDKLNSADAIIFGCPTYMGSASAQFKQFMEESSGIWSQLGWKNKVAAGFTNSGNPHGDKMNTLLQLMVFAMQHAMIWVGLDLPGSNNTSYGSNSGLNRLGSWIGSMAQSLTDLGVEGIDESDLRTAFRLGQRVSEVATTVAVGRLAACSDVGAGNSTR
jgi:multimeric flavodoxin WrbA